MHKAILITMLAVGVVTAVPTVSSPAQAHTCNVSRAAAVCPRRRQAIMRASTSRSRAARARLGANGVASTGSSISASPAEFRDDRRR
jgi:hypothetical protein